MVAVNPGAPFEAYAAGFAAGLEGTLAVRDIVELVEDAMGPTRDAVGATQRSDT